MRWSQRQVSLIWLPDRLHVALCHAAKPHHLRGHHWQHLPALAGEHFDSIFLFRRNVCVCVVVVLVDQHFDTSYFSQEECGETTNCLLYDTDMWVFGQASISTHLMKTQFVESEIFHLGCAPTWCTRPQPSCPSVSSLTSWSSTTPSLSPIAFLFNFDSETLTSSRRQWWRRSRSRWRHRKIQSHCKLSLYLISFNKSLDVLLKPW